LNAEIGVCVLGPSERRAGTEGVST
jgi:hypothetical protein